MPDLHKPLRIRTHERRRHRDLPAIGKNEIGARAKRLDDAEEVIPTTRVEPCRMVAKLVENLLHLEGRVDRLDQRRRANASARYAEGVLSKTEDVVPQARLEMAFHLRQVEIRARAPVERFARIVEEVQAEVEEARRHR